MRGNFNTARSYYIIKMGPITSLMPLSGAAGCDVLTGMGWGQEGWRSDQSGDLKVP